MRGVLLAAALALGGCGQADEPIVDGYSSLVALVGSVQIGSDADQWIEMKNNAGEWEKTGLIFGYFGGDHDECLKAIAGLKQVNYAREYRCVQANDGGGR